MGKNIEDRAAASGMGELTYPYVCVVRVAHIPPEAQEVFELGVIQVVLRHGPFKLQQSVPILSYGEHSAGMTMGTQDISFPAGASLLLQQELGGASLEDGQADARLRNAELLALLDLDFEGLLVEKVFEGPVNRPGQFIFAPQGPMQITARPPVNASDILAALSVGMTALRDTR